ncbi:MAG TPA: DUF4160 domain-containing protein [Dehalococcoidia bacterium]|jgi:hypothetical protein
MPTILRTSGYRFFFYSAEGIEPPHVHVERDGKFAKFWLEPVRLESSSGFRTFELMRIERIVLENQDLMIGRWHDYF